MPTKKDIATCIEQLRRDSESSGYHLNPNQDDLEMVIEGYLENKEKFSYPACPCRLPTGNYEEDKDIVCPCDYRDDDISEYGCCYCSLYVSDEIAAGKTEPGPIPERRDTRQQEVKADKELAGDNIMGLGINVWRCPVCGYLCAKDQPPPKCPICGVERDRFELFIKGG